MKQRVGNIVRNATAMGELSQPYCLPSLLEPVSFTPLPAVAERCADCDYPGRCAEDSTCWKQVSAEGWERTVNSYAAPAGKIRDREQVIASLRAYAAKHGHGPSARELGTRAIHNDIPAESVLRRLFGSATAAYVAAGISWPKPASRYGRQFLPLDRERE